MKTITLSDPIHINNKETIVKDFVTEEGKIEVKQVLSYSYDDHIVIVQILDKEGNVQDVEFTWLDLVTFAFGKYLARI